MLCADAEAQRLQVTCHLVRDRRTEDGNHIDYLNQFADSHQNVFFNGLGSPPCKIMLLNGIVESGLLRLSGSSIKCNTARDNQIIAWWEEPP
jgi:hypothetical protein